MILTTIKSWFQKPREPTLEEKTAELIADLRNQDYGFVYSSDLSMFKLQVTKNNISEYVAYLRKINYHLSTGEEIYPRSVNHKTFTVLLPKWFTVNGVFTKPSEQMSSLLDEATLFMELYNKHDSLLDRNYTQDHNFRMVGNVCGDLLTLLKEIQNGNTKSIHTGSEQTDQNR